MEELSIPHFRELLARNIKEFKDCCTVWENVVSTETVPEEVSDEIRVTIGLTNLLMRQKMKQFGELIDDSEHNRGEKEITCEDLQGFWDMVYNEVEKIQKSFKKLEKCQNNNWVFIEEPISRVEPKKKPNLVSAQIASTAKDRALAARQRLAEAKLKMKAQRAKENSNAIKEGTVKKASTEQAGRLSNGNENFNKIEDSVNLKMPKIAHSLQIENSPAKQKVSPSVKVSASRKKNKENFLSVPEKNTPKSLLKTSNEPALQSKKKSPKEVIPLQCTTRSARRLLLAKENALKSK